MNILELVKNPINYFKLIIFGKRIGEKINELEKMTCGLHCNKLQIWCMEKNRIISRFKKLEKEIDGCKFCLSKSNKKEEENNEFR